MPIRARTALVYALACLVLLSALWFGAFHVGFVKHADQRLFVGFFDPTYEHYQGRIVARAQFLVSLFDPSRFLVLAALCVVIALARRRPRDACAMLVLLGGASLTTMVLKQLLPEPRVVSFLHMSSPVPYPSFPSGHATAAMSLVLAVTLMAPPRFRPLIAGLGAVFAAAVGYALLMLGSHFPTDVFAGFLVAATWALLTAAALSAFERRCSISAEQSRPLSVREALTPPATALVTAAALATIAVLSDSDTVLSYVRANTAFIVGAVVIAALSTVVSTGVVLSVRRDVQR